MYDIHAGSLTRQEYTNVYHGETVNPVPQTSSM